VQRNNKEINTTIQIKLNKDSLKGIAIVFLILFLSLFLFIGGEAQQQHRLIKDTWDSGHLILFALLSYGYFNLTSQTSRSTLYKILFTTIFSLVIGTAIEVIQIFFHREFSRSDIINDVLGGYIGLLALIALNKQQTLKLKTTAVILALLCFAVGFRDMERHLLDELNMHQQFPVLADFETELEMSRWENNLTALKRSQEFVKTGEHSLKVSYLPGRYPNISLEHFKNNWSGYKTLSYSIYNPSHETRSFEIKVYDQKNINRSRSYNDRFNHKITIASGWNTFDIPLNDIISAPKNRSMNIQKIKGFSLFTDRLEQPVTIYIDNIHLE
jgi:VanZ family protein